MKKKNLTFIAILILTQCLFLIAGSGQMNGDYTIRFDTKADGKFVEEAKYILNFNSHSGVIIGKYVKIDNDSIFKGKLYGDNNKIIKFTQYDENFQAVYSGKMIAPDKFQGTWYDTKGRSGDFILEK